jgi:type IV pilus assembly protein PilY1
MTRAMIAVLLLCASPQLLDAAPATPDCPVTASPAWRPANAVIGGEGVGQFMIQSKLAKDGISGTLERIALDLGAASAKAGASVWDAAVILDAADPKSRAIYTLAEEPVLAGTTVPFTWDALGVRQRAELDLTPDGSAADGLGEQRVGFLRGERGGEEGNPGGVFRRRASVLGDMPHSVPLVVGAPRASLSEPGYAAFHALYKTRRHAVYVGANDGMLHAFDAANGEELFAYVPGVLLPALPPLSSPQYKGRAYVDGSAGQGEASLEGRWRSVLVSGMGQGARGVFALDVSNPAAFGQGMGALWEFTEKDDPGMGFVGAAPLVVKLRTGVRAAVPQYRYFALVAGGPTEAGGVASTGAAGTLFLLALDKPAGTAWRRGKDYFRFDTPAADPSQANVLAPPAVALGPDGAVRYAYAGDLQGKLWRFDFSKAAPWSKAVGTLFVARDPDGQSQSITERATVVFAPGGGYVVVFGTTASTQGSISSVQSLYAIHDSAASPPELVNGRAELAGRGLTGGAGRAASVVTGADFTFDGASKGWFLDFVQERGDGEQASGVVVAVSGALVFNTVARGRACAPPVTRTYVLDALSGFALGPDGVARSGIASGRVVPGMASATPLVVRTTVVVGPRGATGRAVASKHFAVLQPAGAGPPIRFGVAAPAGRVSWREVSNWRELHDATIR